MFTSHGIVTSIQLPINCNLTVYIFESVIYPDTWKWTEMAENGFASSIHNNFEKDVKLESIKTMLHALVFETSL